MTQDPFEDYQSRYIAYCKAKGFSSPEAQYEEDGKKFPGGLMCGYINWITCKWNEWSKITKKSRPFGQQDHKDFDLWLDGAA